MADTTDANYWTFYLMGRDEKLLRHKEDMATLVDKLRAPAELRPKLLEVARHACDDYYGVVPNRTRQHRKWLNDHADAITAAGGDKEAAFAAWRQGRIDELAYAIEGQAVEALHDIYGDDDEDGDPEDVGDEDEREPEDD